MRGHWVDGWIVVDGRELVSRSRCRPTTSRPSLSRVTARRWYSGDHVFDSDRVRGRRRARRARCARGAPPARRLRRASCRRCASRSAIALGSRVARELGVPVSVPRARAARRRRSPRAAATVVARLFDDLEPRVARRRSAQRARRARSASRLAGAARRARRRAARAIRVRRADDALDEARRADDRVPPRSTRGAQLDVTYEVDGTRIISMVDAETLQVIDPGICLSRCAPRAHARCDAVGRARGDRRAITSTSRGGDMREVCFLIGRGGAILWADASDSPAALPDSRARWEAIWQPPRRARSDRALPPDRPRRVLRRGRSTMEAIDSALGKPHALLRRRSARHDRARGDGRATPSYTRTVVGRTAPARLGHAARRKTEDGDPEHHVPGPCRPTYELDVHERRAA